MGNLLDFDFDQTDLQDENLESLRSKNMVKVKVRASVFFFTSGCKNFTYRFWNWTFLHTDFGSEKLHVKK